MKKYAVVVLTVRDDLMEGMAKTFFYKNKLPDMDMFFAVEDRMGFDGKKLSGIIKRSSNPNIKSGKVMRMTDWTESFIKSMGGKLNKPWSADALRINQKSGQTLPVIDLLRKGYESVIILEEDQFVVGPIMEVLKSEHSVIASAWGTIHHNRSKNPNSVFARLDALMGTDKVSDEQMDKMGAAGRNPFVYHKTALPLLEEAFIKYVNDEACFKRWIMSNGKGRKTQHRSDEVNLIPAVQKIYDKWKPKYMDKAFGLPTDLWEDSTKINHIVFYKMITGKKFYKVFPGWGRLSKEYTMSDGMPDEKSINAALTSSYIIHYTYGAKKAEAAKLFLKYMDKAGYKGEFSADKFITKRSYNWREEPQWLKTVLKKGIGAEWKEMYKSGTWINPDYLKMIGKEKEDE